MAQQQLSTNTFGTAQWIVSNDATQGTHTTIAAALAAASSGQTIFIRPKSDASAYSENLTLKAGVNLTAYGSDFINGTVIINGKCTFTGSGTVVISGIMLQTNSDYCLAVTGSSASVVYLEDCYINCTNNTGINYTSSSSSSGITGYKCEGNLATTGIGYFTGAGAGAVSFWFSQMSNTGSSVTVSSLSVGTVASYYSAWTCSLGTTSTANITCYYSVFNTVSTLIPIVHNGSGTPNALYHCYIDGGSNTAISLGAGSGLVLATCISVGSSNTNAITGTAACTLTYDVIHWLRSSSTINAAVTQQTNAVTTGALSSQSITFAGANQSALSIFQQGTFSPTVVGQSVAGTVNMTTQIGRYQKVGRICTVYIAADWSTIGTATGNPLWNNMPFTAVNVAGLNPIVVCIGHTNVLTTAASAVPCGQALLNTATANIIYYLGATGAASNATITATNGFQYILSYETT